MGFPGFLIRLPLFLKLRVLRYVMKFPSSPIARPVFLPFNRWLGCLTK
nr:MAG TPA: hypothetical protein [Caudoviricetes sp.]